MSENPESPGENPFSPPPNAEDEPSFGQGSPFEQQESPPDFGASASGGGEFAMAWSVARMWIKEHQREAMLGAFATGVFVGAYLRD